MKYRAMDGYELEAESLQQVAEKLWQSMLNPDATLEEWMAGSARRAAIYNGSVISTASVEEHVRDLIRAGFVTPLDA